MHHRTTWTFHTAGKLIFGRDAVLELGNVAEELGARRVLVVTDGDLQGAGLVERVQTPLTRSKAVVEVFDGGAPNAPIQAVAAALEVAHAFRPDVLLGLGGGSNMDIAKATAAVLAHGGSSRDYAGDQVVPGPVFPLICVPTTAGTGSEVTAAAVMSDAVEGTKFGILSNHLRPRIAVVDPMLTVSCPAKVTADSGIDALTHAVESFTAVDNESFPLPAGERTVYQGRHALGDLLAERAIELIGRHLGRAVADGSDLEAREAMALAALLAGMSFSNVGVAVVHALEFALTEVAHTTHGAGNGLLLPFVMRFNKSSRPTQMARIATLLGEDTAGLDDDEAGELAIAAVERLKRDIGIPARLRDVGVATQHLAGMAEKAFAIKRILRVNPRAVTCEDLRGILESAL